MFKKVVSIFVIVAMSFALIVPVGAIPTPRHIVNVDWTINPGAERTSTIEIYLNTNDWLGVNFTFTPLSPIQNSPKFVEIGIVNEFNTPSFSQFYMGNPNGILNTDRWTGAPANGVYRLRVKNTNLGVPVRVTGSYMYTKRSYQWHADCPNTNPTTVNFFSGTPTVQITDYLIEQFGGFTLAHVTGLAQNSVNAWNSSADPVHCTFSSTGGANIFIRAGRPQYLLERWGVDLSEPSGGISVAHGQLFYGNTVNPVRTRVVNGISRTIKIDVNPNNIYFANKQQSGTLIVHSKGITVPYSARSAIGHQNTLTHELGHGLGICGHATSTSDLMSGTSNTVAMSPSLQNRDHITQFKRAWQNGTLN
ncbi:MAG: hypothetical protein FWH07_04760 [Oscillospiraceae bacterium]|nr:hypothetical protein [Oscillospiraceae bacterium]